MTDAIIRLVLLFVLIVGFQIAVSRIALAQEAKRRWQHALTGHILVQASYILPMQLGVAGLLLGAAGMAYFRFLHPEQFVEAVGPLLRPEELEPNRLPGAFYFLIGTAMTALSFDLSTTRYAVECLALADPMAAFVGKTISSPRLNQSASVAGSLGCFATSWLCGYFMLPDLNVVRITCGALACTIAEALPFGNDNITIPLATAAIVTLFTST